MKKLWIVLSLLLVSSLGHAQAPSAFPYAKPIPNDATTGTTQFTLTKINASGNALIMAITDTAGYSGVCVANCGKTGTAWIVFAGLTPLTMENTATALHYVTVGTATAGNGHDSGATTYPTGGGDVVGRIQIGAAATAQAMVDLFGPETQASAALTAGTTWMSLGGIGNPASVAIANHTICGGVIIPPGGLSVGHIDFRVTTADGANNSDVGIYNSSGTLQAHIGAQVLASTGNIQLAFTGGTQTISAGKAYVCFTSIGTALAIDNGATRTFLGTQDIGVTSSGGALPASITPPANTYGNQAYPSIVLYP